MEIMKEALRATVTHFFQRGGRELFVETRTDNVPVVRMIEGFLGQGQSGGWSSVGSFYWRFGWASWRYGR